MNCPLNQNAKKTRQGLCSSEKKLVIQRVMNTTVCPQANPVLVCSLHGSLCSRTFDNFPELILLQRQLRRIQAHICYLHPRLPHNRSFVWLLQDMHGTLIIHGHNNENWQQLLLFSIQLPWQAGRALLRAFAKWCPQIMYTPLNPSIYLEQPEYFLTSVQNTFNRA